MKRGNTALKRGVGLASAFALAIAGAVVAAPAASAVLPTADTDIVRAQPIANANQIGADGNKLPSGMTPGDPSYSATISTGNLPTIQAGVKGQRVSALQIFIPGTTVTTVWEATKPIDITLPAGITVNGTPSAVATSKTITLADAAKKASPALGTTTVTNYNNINVGVSATAGAGKITLTPNADLVASAAVPTTDGVVVTVSGIYVDVADDFVVANPGTSAGDNAVKATVSTGAVALGATTLGYVSGLAVSSAGTYPANAKTVALPAITITELSKAAFPTTNLTVVLKLTTDPVGSPTAATFVAGAATVSTDGSTAIESTTTPVTAAATGDTLTVTFPAARSDATKLESVTITGLKVQDVPSAAKVNLTVATPAGTSTADGAYSFTPDQSSYASVSISSEVNPPRTAGNNRYETAALIAQKGIWSNKAVVLANGLDVKSGVDALSANFLAGAKTAPILLTDSSNTLPTATQLALTRLFSGQSGDLTIYVLGKTDSVSKAAQDSALAIVKAAANSAAKVTVVNVAGNNRYETSAAVVGSASTSIRSYDLGAGAFKTAFLASGVVNADALAAGGFSAGAGIPVLLVADGAKALDDSVAKAITDQRIGQVIVLGATDRVSDDVVAQLKDKLGVSNVIRKAGTDRFITAADVNTMAFKAAPDGLGLALADDTAYLANGIGGWADALTVGPLAGQQTAPVLTVPVNSLPSATQSFLSTNKANISAIEALGQSDRIADSVITAAQTAIK